MKRMNLGTIRTVFIAVNGVLVLSMCIACLPGPMWISTQTTTVGHGEAVILARRGPKVVGRLAEPGQVVIAGAIALDPVSQGVTTRDQGSSGHRVPWISGGGHVAYGLPNNFELSLSAAGGSSSSAVAVASDGAGGDPIRSSTIEVVTGVRAGVTQTQRVRFVLGTEIGMQLMPSIRFFESRSVTMSQYPMQPIMTSTSSSSHWHSSTYVGAFSNFQLALVALLHPVVQLEFGGSIGGFTAVAGRSSSERFCASGMGCTGDTDDQPTGLTGGFTGTGFVALTLGNRPIQAVFQGTATGVSPAASTGNILGFLAGLRIAFGQSPAAPSATPATPAAAPAAAPSAPVEREAPTTAGRLSL